ncbi:MAG: gamma-glutamylcyclotransferase [Paracoccaceae bacterium]
MADYFFYGTLCHRPLLESVLGRTVLVVAARSPGYQAFWAKGQAYPVLVEGGDGAVGVYVPGLSDADVARLAFYENGFDYRTRDLAVETAGGELSTAEVFLPGGMSELSDLPWRLEDWVKVWGETAVATAEDFMAHFGKSDPAAVRRRYGQMLVRGSSRVRASRLREGSQSLRREYRGGDVDRLALMHPYSGYFAVEEYDLRFRRFDGTMSEVLNRAVFISGDAAVILPYDPVRDRVMVIEQFRAGPYARGDANPWLIEAVAGRIDGGETPEAAARREAQEEAGLELRDLLVGPSYYPSPAAKAEYIYSFIGIADLPESAAGIGGLDVEAEDIRSHVIPYERLTALMASGEVDNAPLMILVQWLERIRPELRAASV